MIPKVKNPINDVSMVGAVINDIIATTNKLVLAVNYLFYKETDEVKANEILAELLSGNDATTNT